MVGKTASPGNKEDGVLLWHSVLGGGGGSDVAEHVPAVAGKSYPFGGAGKVDKGALLDATPDEAIDQETAQHEFQIVAANIADPARFQALIQLFPFGGEGQEIPVIDPGEFNLAKVNDNVHAGPEFGIIDGLLNMTSHAVGFGLTGQRDVDDPRFLIELNTGITEHCRTCC